MEAAIVGKWKCEKTEGEMEQFLKDKGVPMLLAKALKFLGSGGKFEFAITDGAFVETEIGMMSSKTYEPIPLDGTEVKDKAPDTSDVTKTCVMEADKFTITEVSAKDAEDKVICVFTLDGDSLKRTFTNSKTGTTFSAILVKM